MSAASALACVRCGASYPLDRPFDARGCPACHAECPANLEVVYEGARSEGAGSDGAKAHARCPEGLASLWRYADALPIDAADAVTLGEGLTPLLPAPLIGFELGVPELYLKHEGANPTWSHKDRFSTLAVSAARRAGARLVATSSSGNAGASLAAYAARAGMACVVATFAGTAGPMLGQIRKYGATVVAFERKADRWSFIAEGVERHGWFATSPFRAPVVGSHPIGIEGYKTLAYELVEQLGGEAPDWVIMPVCYGDALAGLWRGFKALFERRAIAELPRLGAAEVHGSLAEALARGGDHVPDVQAGFDTLAVSIGATRSTFQALQALRESGGAAVPVGNDGLIAVQERLAAREGVFVELASATTLSAIAALRERRVIGERDRVVAVVTASGLKDLDRSAHRLEPLPRFSSTAEAWRHLAQDADAARPAAVVQAKAPAFE